MTRKLTTKGHNNSMDDIKNELQNAYIMFHSPWISKEEKEYWWGKIKRLQGNATAR